MSVWIIDDNSQILEIYCGSDKNGRRYIVTEDTANRLDSNDCIDGEFTIYNSEADLLKEI